jgi:hypothetical protein
VKTIIYITNNVLNPVIANACIKKLKEAAGDNPIISVSQKPIKLGKNICVGDIGSSRMSIYKQQLTGLRESTTEHIAIAEHDVLYTKEHFEFDPLCNDVFYYNVNLFFLNWSDDFPERKGKYSNWGKPRICLSQLITSRQLLIDYLEERLKLMELDTKHFRELTEPTILKQKDVEDARSAVKVSHCHLSKLLEEHLATLRVETFQNKYPNIDIRHGQNFTGPRMANRATYSVPYWGELKNYL